MAEKWGEGTLAAMGRLGLKELRNAINPSKESVADSEIGVYGTKTQGEIAEARGGPGGGSEQEASLTIEEMREDAKTRGAEVEKHQDRGIER